jgi:hypothetical protein
MIVLPAVGRGKTAVQGHTKKSETRHPDRIAQRVMAQTRIRFFLKVMFRPIVGPPFVRLSPP